MPGPSPAAWKCSTRKAAVSSSPGVDGARPSNSSLERVRIASAKVSADMAAMAASTSVAASELWRRERATDRRRRAGPRRAAGWPARCACGRGRGWGAGAVLFMGRWSRRVQGSACRLGRWYRNLPTWAALLLRTPGLSANKEAPARIPGEILPGIPAPVMDLDPCVSHGSESTQDLFLGVASLKKSHIRTFPAVSPAKEHGDLDLSDPFCRQVTAPGDARMVILDIAMRPAPSRSVSVLHVEVEHKDSSPNRARYTFPKTLVSSSRLITWFKLSNVERAAWNSPLIAKSRASSILKDASGAFSRAIAIIDADPSIPVSLKPSADSA